MQQACWPASHACKSCRYIVLNKFYCMQHSMLHITHVTYDETACCIYASLLHAVNLSYLVITYLVQKHQILPSKIDRVMVRFDPIAADVYCPCVYGVGCCWCRLATTAAAAAAAAAAENDFESKSAACSTCTALLRLSGSLIKSSNTCA